MKIIVTAVSHSQAAREPTAGDLAKAALMRTASAPETPPLKPAAAQTSGLDWSGSIEAGPTLIRKSDQLEKVRCSLLSSLRTNLIQLYAQGNTRVGPLGFT